MRKTMTAFFFSALILSSTAKESNINMRAGLWEITTSSDMLLLAQHIPQAQLEDIAQIAKEYGLEMPQLENGAAISKTCITQAMAEQQTLPQLYQEELGCNTNSNSRHGNYYKASFSCNSRRLKGHGVVEGKMMSPISFNGTSQFKGVAEGAPVNEKASFEGKWLHTDCGQG